MHPKPPKHLEGLIALSHVIDKGNCKMFSDKRQWIKLWWNNHKLTKRFCIINENQKFQAEFHCPKKFPGISQTTHYIKEAKPWPIKRHVEILLHDFFLNNIIFQAADTHKIPFSVK